MQSCSNLLQYTTQADPSWSIIQAICAHTWQGVGANNTFCHTCNFGMFRIYINSCKFFAAMLSIPVHKINPSLIGKIYCPIFDLYSRVVRRFETQLSLAYLINTLIYNYEQANINFSGERALKSSRMAETLNYEHEHADIWSAQATPGKLLLTWRWLDVVAVVCQRNDGGCVVRIGLKVWQKVILLIDTETNTVAPGFYVYGLCAILARKCRRQRVWTLDSLTCPDTC